MTSQWVTKHGRTFEVGTLDSAVPPAPKRRHRRFTKFPGMWEDVLGKARVSGSTYAVALVLVYEAWSLSSRGGKPVVKLTDVMLRRRHVGRRGKRAALSNLERLKLVDVERRPNRNPLVTVHFFD